MFTRQLSEVERRKSVLIEQCRVGREDFDKELEPIQVWVDKAELGFKLAKQGKDLLLMGTPILLAMLKGKGGMLKAALYLFSNWSVLKGVWSGFRAMRS